MCKAEFTPSKGCSMARTAGQMPRGLASIDVGPLVHALVQPLRADGALGVEQPQGDELTTRAVACSGLVALFGLPILLLASVVLGAPLAAPAAIALGYLAMSYALASDHPRSAAVINTVVLVGLVVWSLAFLLIGEELSRGALAAALLAPIFAAAPALARLAMAPRMDRAAGIAQRNTACLDQLAPDQAVLVVRRDGTLLAATQAARTDLAIPAGPSGDVDRCFALVDRPKLSDAVARCRPGAPAVKITLHGSSDTGCEARRFAAEVSGGEGETVAIRLRAVEAQGPALQAAAETVQGIVVPTAERAGPVCDVGEAAVFAVRHAQASARSKRVLLTSAVEERAIARCDRQICRRILVLMIESALTRSDPGDALQLTGRTMPGVALLRLVRVSISSDRQAAPDLDRQDDIAALRLLVEQAGGTLMVSRSADEMQISVRLDVEPHCDKKEDGER
jgi:hypothetical protein